MLDYIHLRLGSVPRKTRAVLHLKMQPPHIVRVLGGRVALPDTTLRIKGVDTHANGRKKKEEEGEARRQEEDSEAAEEEIVRV